jgi:integrase
MAVPRHLVDRLGRQELSATLRTSNPVEARLRCRSLSNIFDLFFEELRDMNQVSQAEIEERIRSYFQKALNKGAELVLDVPTDEMMDIDAEIASVRQNVETMRRDLVQARFSNLVTADARELLNPESPDSPIADLDALRQAQIMVLRAKIEYFRIYAAKLAGDYGATVPSDPLFAGMQSTGLPSLPGEAKNSGESVQTFSQIVERYLSFKAPGWERKTLQAVQKALRHAQEVIGANRSVKLIANADVTRFRDVLARIPPNFSKLKQFDGMTLPEIAAQNATGTTLSAKSQKKDLDFLHAFLSWATEEGYLEKQPGSKVKIGEKKKSPPGKDRLPYDAAQLSTIFASPIFTGCSSATRRGIPGSMLIKDGKYWVPIIAIYSGLRLGEIVQLLTRDVAEEGDVLYFDVTKTEEDDKHIKTQSSYRRVPVHQRLIELGFLDHLAQARKTDRLFPDIAQGQDGYYSHNFSKFWGRYVRLIKAFKPKTAFHSFRHNFKDALTHAGVTEAVSKALMGHSDKSVHDSYGSGPSLQMMKAAIDKIQIKHAP